MNEYTLHARVTYAGSVIDLPVRVYHVAGAWYIAQRKSENLPRRNRGVPEYGYGLSNWGVYHEPSGLVAAYFRGRLQAIDAAQKASGIWNGEKLADAPLETRNAVRILFRDAPGRIQ
jgi:hypothetical protein